MSERELPKVGTGVYIRKDGKILLGKRRAGNGKGMWCPPGGHLEMYETFEENAVRETMEESGVEIQNVRLMSVTNNFSEKAGKHYVTLHFYAEWTGGEPGDVEPDKMGDWAWFEWDTLPEPLFFPVKSFLNQNINPLEFLG